VTSKLPPATNPATHARTVGHRRYDQLLQEIIDAVSKNESREELLQRALTQLEQFSGFGALAVLELERTGSSGVPSYVIKGIDQRRIVAARWRAYLDEAAKRPFSSGLIVNVAVNGVEVALWQSNYFQQEFSELKGLFAVGKGGWLAALRLPSPTARHFPRAIFVWYPSSPGNDPPQGAEQDWRFFSLFRSCYGLASFQTRKVAVSLIETRKELLKAIAPSLLAHEVYGRLEKMSASFETLLAATDQKKFSVIKSEVRDTLIPYLASIMRVSHSLMALTRRFAGRLIDPVVEISNARDVLTHLIGKTGGWVELPQGAGPQITSDPALLMHIFVNLIKNALEAADSVNIKFELAVTSNAESEPLLIIDVIDNGPGVPPGAEGKLFQIGTTTKPHGHGLGLHVSQMIAEHLGGNLALHRPRDPTAFRLSLPLRSSKLEDLEDELRIEQLRTGEIYD